MYRNMCVALAASLTPLIPPSLAAVTMLAGGFSDADTDGDGALNNCASVGQPRDTCINDPAKTAPGVWYVLLACVRVCVCVEWGGGGSAAHVNRCCCT